MAHICEQCLDECDVIEIDDGIGPYEHHGERGIHHEYIPASDCCEANVFDGEITDVHEHHEVKNGVRYIVCRRIGHFFDEAGKMHKINVTDRTEVKA